MNKPLEYTLEVQWKPVEDGLWYWQIIRTSTGEVVESGKDGFTTEEECREQAAPFLGDWFAGHMNS
jgi:hypothetical protein